MPGQHFLLDADEEPEPKRPRARPRLAADGLDDASAMCALRAVLTDTAGPLARDALTKEAARRLGHRRPGKQIAASIDDAIRRAVRRGIAENGRQGLQLAVRQIDGYDRKHLGSQLIAALRTRRGWVERSELPKLLARRLGFARTGATITETAQSLLRRRVGSGHVELTRDAVRVAKG